MYAIVDLQRDQVPGTKGIYRGIIYADAGWAKQAALGANLPVYKVSVLHANIRARIVRDGRSFKSWEGTFRIEEEIQSDGGKFPLAKKILDTFEAYDCGLPREVILEKHVKEVVRIQKERDEDDIPSLFE